MSKEEILQKAKNVKADISLNSNWFGNIYYFTLFTEKGSLHCIEDLDRKLSFESTNIEEIKKILATLVKEV
jgi:tyrosyl-tRNA synthetase